MPIPVKTFIPGIKVIRGEDWDWDDQDGGEGNVGEMIDKSESEGWVKVKWEKNNYTASYRIGKDDEYDLYFADDKGTWATRTDVIIQKIYKPLPTGEYFELPTEVHKKHVTTWLDSIGWQRIHNDTIQDDYLFTSSNNKYHTGEGCTIDILPFEALYEYGMPQFVEPTLVQREEVFPGIYVGDVVVSLSDMSHNRRLGDLFVVLAKSTKGYLNYNEFTNSNTPSYWRIATTEEKEFYNNGGKNVNDMKPETVLTNNAFLIAEAIKRYPVGTKFYPVHTPVDPRQYCIITGDSEFIIDDGNIYSAINGVYWMPQRNEKYGTTILNRKVYCKKKGWAQIVKEEKQELSPLEKCKQMYSAGDLVEAFDHKGRKLSRMLLTEIGLQQLQVYKNNGNSVRYPGLPGYLYCSHNEKYARIIEKRLIFNNQTKTKQNGNETTTNQKCTELSRNITEHDGRVIKVSRLSTKIGISTESRRVAVPGRRCRS